MVKWVRWRTRASNRSRDPVDEAKRMWARLDPSPEVEVRIEPPPILLIFLSAGFLLSQSREFSVEGFAEIDPLAQAFVTVWPTRVRCLRVHGHKRVQTEAHFARAGKNRKETHLNLASLELLPADVQPDVVIADLARASRTGP